MTAIPVTHNLDEMSAALRRLRDLERPIARRALVLAGNAINAVAQIAAPVKTGALKASHSVDDSNPDQVRIGATIEYALAVHAKHPTSANWYLGVVVSDGPGILSKAVQRAIGESARDLATRARSSGGAA